MLDPPCGAPTPTHAHTRTYTHARLLLSHAQPLLAHPLPYPPHPLSIFLYADLAIFTATANASIISLNLSLMLNAVGFYQVAKLLIIPFVCGVERLWLGRRFSRQVTAAVGVVVVGVAIVYVWGLGRGGGGGGGGAGARALRSGG
jgi:hypothetical protein